MILKTSIIRDGIIQLAKVINEWRQAFTQTKAAPHSVALAFALGTFISLLPTPGLNLILVTFLASLFKQLNRAGLLASVAVWNTLIVAPFYAISHKVGLLVLNHSPIILANDSPGSLALPFLIGNVLIAMMVTALSFIAVRISLNRYQMRGVRIK